MRLRPKELLVGSLQLLQWQWPLQLLQPELHLLPLRLQVFWGLGQVGTGELQLWHQRSQGPMCGLPLRQF